MRSRAFTAGTPAVRLKYITDGNAYELADGLGTAEFESERVVLFV
jgi:hypothetical protein